MRAGMIGVAMGFVLCSGCSGSDAGAGECKKAVFEAYCAGATAGLSQGSEQSDPDLSTALKVKSSEYSAAFSKDGYEALAQKYLRTGAEESARSSEAKMMKSILALCVNDDTRARSGFVKRIAQECAVASDD